MSLGTKTTALLAVIISAVLIGASLFLLHYQEESIQQTIYEGLDNQAKITADGVHSFVQEGREDADAISLAFPVKALQQRKLAVAGSYLRQMVENFPKFRAGIFILDRRGTFLVDYPPHPGLRGQSFAFRQYYRRTIHDNRGIVARPYKSKRTGLPVLTFTAPVRDARGKLIAVVACSVNLLSQEALGGYRKQKFWDTGYLYVFDTTRQLILHPQDDRLLTNVPAGKNRIMEAALAGFEGVGETVNSKGVPMLIAVRQVHSMGWMVAVQIPTQEAYAPLAATRERIFLVSGFALFLVLAVGAAAIRRVTMPLQRLERAASEIGKSLGKAETDGICDLGHCALDDLKRIRSHDEIGLLALSFLHLAQRLNLYIAERQTTEEKMSALLRTDVLTGLPNRLLLLERLQDFIGLAVQQGVVRSRPRVGVMFMDLDRFKNINDSLGHHVGDRVLIEVAQRLQSVVRASDTVARMGGDEFVIVLPHMESAGDAEAVARRVIAAMAAPVSAGGHDLSVTASIGLATWPDMAGDIASLMSRADAAMYRAKRAGLNNWCWSDPDEASVMPRRLRLETELRHALERGQLAVYFQPQYDCRSRDLVGAEALLRWHHPDLGEVSPLEFIPLAEESGLIVPIGTWVLREALRHVVRWNASGEAPLHVSVNLSPRQMNTDSVVAIVADALAKSRAAPHMLELEITEGTIVREVQSAARRLRQLSDLGIVLAIDDFGVGYSSLSYLRDLPVQKLKIDRSFIRTIPNDEGTTRLVAALIAMAHQLRLGVVAEGVESEAQLTVLRELGCETLQGFLLGKPMEAHRFERIVRARAALRSGAATPLALVANPAIEAARWRERNEA